MDRNNHKLAGLNNLHDEFNSYGIKIPAFAYDYSEYIISATIEHLIDSNEVFVTIFLLAHDTLAGTPFDKSIHGINSITSTISCNFLGFHDNYHYIYYRYNIRNTLYSNDFYRCYSTNSVNSISGYNACY